MVRGIPRRRPGRPVSDAALEQLEQRSEDLTKAWLLELIERRPLHDAARLLSGGLTREGPRLCAAIVRALGSDRELAALQPGGALAELAAGAAQLAGSSEPEAALEALAALIGVVWAAARAAFSDPEAELIAQLAERLARIEAVLRAAVLREDARRAPGGADGAVGEATVEDRRGGRPLWLAAIDEEVAQARAARSDLSLLLVELEDADRLRAVEPEAEASAVFGRFAQALRGELGRDELFARAGQERAWVIARGADRDAARGLAQRIAAAIAAAPPWLGAPLRASIGIAVLGEDGDDAESLVEHAGQSQLAASAAGVATVD
jgi:GGDEF domain-containing protein